MSARHLCQHCLLRAASLWLVAAGTPEAAATRHTVVDPNGKVVGNDPDCSPVSDERVFDPTGAQRDARRRLLDEWTVRWSERAPFPARAARP